MRKPSKSQLYDAMGELIYAVAKEEGNNLQTNLTIVNDLLANKIWASEVQWSFNYEYSHDKSMEEAYTKAIDTCKAYGPTEEYAFLMEALEILGNKKSASKKPDPSMLLRFQNDLTQHFQSIDLV